MPVPELDEREVVAAMLEAEPDLAADRPGLLLAAELQALSAVTRSGRHRGRPGPVRGTATSVRTWGKAV
ncbi:hypothetical protein [Actinomadura sp. NBRC 104425]|uniref:hypothetical protein n=1 Tax=Actinomadura sp. NBRC 104425 TaxID=3032204 RepID=UPI0025532465|nr:hypothetical protein [Actinomadura sp. NBRC 104425]